MSHEDRLPERVDVVVLGTDLAQSIIAAACSRSGLSVLHLDANEYYGGNWASFHLRNIADWVKHVSSEGNFKIAEADPTLLKDGEQFVALDKRSNVSLVQMKWHVCEQCDEGKQCCSDVDRSSKEEIERNWRSFSLDLLPKVLLSRGEMVQLLCDSGVSKYSEFKCVDRFLCCSSGGDSSSSGPVSSFEAVPCSRADIFQSNNLSPLDKRRVMRFLSSCINWQKNPEELPGWKEYSERPFDEFLEQQGITGKLKLYVADTIGILQSGSTTRVGLTAVYKFLESLGRFGNSPFLWTLYGSGELPQCFCRLCAVFGGTYCLNRPIQGLVLAAKRVVAVIAEGQRIECDHVIADCSYLPEQYLQHENEERVQRAVLISDGSLLQDPEKEHISLLNLRRLDPSLSARLLEVGYEGCAAPKNYYEDTRPRLLWSLLYDVVAPLTKEAVLPENLHLVPSADASLDYSAVVCKARDIFKEVWSDRDFLPPSLKKDEEEESTEEHEQQAEGEGNKGESTEEREQPAEGEADKCDVTSAPDAGDERSTTAELSECKDE